MSTTLTEILEATRARVQTLKPHRTELARDAEAAAAAPDFVGALRQSTVAVIAEVKRRSPSAGRIADHLDPARLGSAYEQGGASAISVLTEPDFFGGSLDDLRAVRNATAVPILRKDFIVDPLQIFEARAAGASAVLLIVRALSDAELADLHACALAVGLTPLVETHAADELDRALAIGPRVVGVNSRDLDTLAIDVDRILPLLRQLPPNVVAVAESGLEYREDVQRVADAGADAVLIGTHLAGHAAPADGVRAFTGVPSMPVRRSAGEITR